MQVRPKSLHEYQSRPLVRGRRFQDGGSEIGSRSAIVQSERSVTSSKSFEISETQKCGRADVALPGGTGLLFFCFFVCESPSAVINGSKCRRNSESLRDEGRWCELKKESERDY